MKKENLVNRASCFSASAGISYSGGKKVAKVNFKYHGLLRKGNLIVCGDSNCKSMKSAITVANSKIASVESKHAL